MTQVESAAMEPAEQQTNGTPPEPAAESRLSPRASGATAFGATILVFAALARFGLGAHGLLVAFVSAVLVVLSAIDLDRRLIPNRIVLPATAVVLVWQIVFFPDRTLEWVLAALGAGAFFLVVHLVSPPSIGLGDVKLALLLGAALGIDVVAALFIGSLAAGAYGLVLVARHGSGARKQTIPLGPFLAFGTIVTLFLT